ncbi:MAG: bifunctional phosphoribosylaminoimidazolecarboxamide formyltransferase/IMP cyclohydrolase [Candidatus Omnitrophica bacterium]|nr:bifunctional phosphoribosylaminoimidazolecarboxamide formyltransferase/IMP cyclohydrolase [Candidatus Omnitrophota bacterium]
MAAVNVKRALLSCHDKAGLDVFARGLAELGVELVASGGTAAFLKDRGLRVTSVEDFAGITEQLDGRVKTLHPKIHAGILARRDDPAHVQAVGAGGLIDLVVVNLYPFEATSRKSGVSLAEAVEQIDIGGVALLRAAAKNFTGVAVVSAPQQYLPVLDALTRGKGALPDALSRSLATEAFRLTSAYDQLIAGYLAPREPAPSSELVTVQARLRQTLRYGENPHQRAGWYVPPPAESAGGLAGLIQLQGKELTYNNLLDLDAAVRCLAEFERPTCVIVKHASPCGIASAASAAEAYQRAHEADTESAFGGIVALNRPLDIRSAEQMSRVFLEVIIAPSVEPPARQAFAKKPNLRLLEWPAGEAAAGSMEWRTILGGWLAQEPDRAALDDSLLRVVTTRQPTEAERRDLRFAWLCAKHVKSNAIVLAKDEATVGIGQGQPSRLRAVRLAIQNAGGRGRGAVLASDGFFPFPDNVEAAAQAGVAALIQPGGSVKDADVTAAADRAGLAMLFTGLRHFKH